MPCEKERHLQSESVPDRALTFAVGVDHSRWWSWGDLNPRPQAFIAQFYMFSDLI